MLTVYHGSTSSVEQPLAGVCRPNLDFGVGFYVYNTDTYRRLTQQTGDLYLMSDLYIVDEVTRELQNKQ